MAAARDPELLTIRRGLRLLQQADPERFTEHARALAFALESLAGQRDHTPQRQAEARRLADALFQLYPFQQAFQP